MAIAASGPPCASQNSKDQPTISRARLDRLAISRQPDGVNAGGSSVHSASLGRESRNRRDRNRSSLSGRGRPPPEAGGAPTGPPGRQKARDTTATLTPAIAAPGGGRL